MNILNALVLEDDFIKAFDELLKKEMPAIQCMQVIQSFDELLNHYNILKRTQVAIVSKHAIIDDKGGIKFDDKGNAIFKSKDAEKQCQEEIFEIRGESIEIPLADKIKIYDDDISTPRKLFLLQSLIDVVEREVPKAPEIKQ